MARKNKKKSQIFKYEYAQLEHAESVLEKLQAEEKPSYDELHTHYREITAAYKRMLEETRLITSVSDRLQNKLNRASDEVKAKNKELEDTIFLLTQARAGRKAATYVLGITVILFIISETLVEPQIDTFVESFGEQHQYDFWISLFFKGLIAVLIKPLEGIIERYLIKQEFEKSKQLAAETTA